MVYFITGLPGVGKTTLAKKIVNHLSENGRDCIMLDGDNMRECWPNIAYGPESRIENMRRIRVIADLFHKEGKDIIISVVAPIASIREEFRNCFDHSYKEILLTKIYEKRPDHYYCKYEESSQKPEFTDDEITDFFK